jgi:hypothetical protein
MVRNDEERDTEWIAPSPHLSRLVRVATTDDGTDAGHRPVEHLPVGARRLTFRFTVVAPRAAEDLVVRSLTTIASTAARSVIRPDDVAVHGHRDPRDRPRRSSFRHRPVKRSWQRPQERTGPRRRPSG